MDMITLAELTALGGAPDATHAVFHQGGELYFCVNAKTLDEEKEREFWSARGAVMKKVVAS